MSLDLTLLKEHNSLAKKSQMMNEKLTSLSTTVRFNIFIDETIMLMETYIEKCKELVSGLLAAGQGRPSSTFLNPSSLEKVIKFAQRNGANLIFVTDIVKYYQTAETAIITKDLDIIVMNKIKIPTYENSGTLYKVSALPMFHSGNFITLETNGITHFVSNIKGEYVELTADQISNCQTHVDIRICQNELWHRPEYPTCLSSLFHSDEKSVNEICNFSTDEESQITMPVFIGSNRWHYAVRVFTKALISCKKQGTVVNELGGNGIISLNAGCTAKMGKYVIRSQSVYMNNSFNIEEHTKLLNYTNISETKIALALKDLDMDRSEFKETEGLHLNTAELIKKIEMEREELTYKRWNTGISNDLNQTKTFNYVLATISLLFILCAFFFIGRLCFEKKCMNKN